MNEKVKSLLLHIDQCEGNELDGQVTQKEWEQGASVITESYNGLSKEDKKSWKQELKALTGDLKLKNSLIYFKGLNIDGDKKLDCTKPADVLKQNPAQVLEQAGEDQVLSLEEISISMIQQLPEVFTSIGGEKFLYKPGSPTPYSQVLVDAQTKTCLPLKDATLVKLKDGSFLTYYQDLQGSWAIFSSQNGQTIPFSPPEGCNQLLNTISLSINDGRNVIEFYTKDDRNTDHTFYALADKPNQFYALKGYRASKSLISSGLEGDPFLIAQHGEETYSILYPTTSAKESHSLTSYSFAYPENRQAQYIFSIGEDSSLKRFEVPQGSIVTEVDGNSTDRNWIPGPKGPAILENYENFWLVYQPAKDGSKIKCTIVSRDAEEVGSYTLNQTPPKKPDLFEYTANIEPEKGLVFIKQNWEPEPERIGDTSYFKNYRTHLVSEGGMYYHKIKLPAFEVSIHSDRLTHGQFVDKQSLAALRSRIPDYQNLVAKLKNEGYIFYDKIEVMNGQTPFFFVQNSGQTKVFNAKGEEKATFSTGSDYELQGNRLIIKATGAFFTETGENQVFNLQ